MLPLSDRVISQMSLQLTLPDYLDQSQHPPVTQGTLGE